MQPKEKEAPPVAFHRNAEGMISRVKEHFRGDANPQVLKEAVRLFERFRPVHRLNRESFGRVMVTGFLASLHCLQSHSTDPEYAMHLPSAAGTIAEHPEYTEAVQEAVRALVQTKLCEEAAQGGPSQPRQGVAADECGGRQANVDQAKKRAQRALRALAGLPEPVVQHLKDETEHWLSAMRALEKAEAEAANREGGGGEGQGGIGIGHEFDRMFETNKMVFSVNGPHTLNYGEDKNDELCKGVHIVFSHKCLYHPDVFLSPTAVTFYNSGHADAVRPWWLRAKKQDAFESMVAEKLHPSSPLCFTACAYEFLGRVAHAKNIALNAVTVAMMLEYWKKENAHFMIECHLPYVTPLTLVEKVVVSDHSFRKLSPAHQDKARRLFGERLLICPDSDAAQWAAAMAPLPEPAQKGGFAFTLASAGSSYAVLPIRLRAQEALILFRASAPDFAVSLSASQDAAHDARAAPCTVQVKDQRCWATRALGPAPASPVASCEQFNQDLNAGAASVVYCLEYNAREGTLCFRHAGASWLLNRQQLRVNRLPQNFQVLTFAAARGTVAFTDVRVVYGEQWLEEHERKSAEMPAPTVPVGRQRPRTEDSGGDTMDAMDAMDTEEPGFMTRQFNKAVRFFAGIWGGQSQPLCGHGARCEAAYQVKECDRTAAQQQHMQECRHLCLRGKSCRARDEREHAQHFLHLDKPTCPEEHCRLVGDLQHRLEFHHSDEWDLLLPCRYGKACRTRDAQHTRRYHHQVGDYEIKESSLRFIQDQDRDRDRDALHDETGRSGNGREGSAEYREALEGQESYWREGRERGRQQGRPGASGESAGQEQAQTSQGSQSSGVYDFGAIDVEVQDSLDDMGDIYNMRAVNGDYAGAQLDIYGNPMGGDFDLVADGAMRGYKVLIGCFYNVQNDLRALTIPELHKKGWQVEVEQQVPAFIAKLQQGQFHVAWLISSDSTSPDSRALLGAVRQFHEAGRGLMVWGDNAPFFVQANEVLQPLFGFQLQGNTPGGKEMVPGNPRTAGHFGEHFICAGLQKLHEGVTICYPTRVPDGWKVFGTSSNSQPVLMAKDVVGKQGPGRVVVDNGFTKLMSAFWTTAGTPRYVSNCCAWLAWKERFKGPLRGFNLQPYQG